MVALNGSESHLFTDMKLKLWGENWNVCGFSNSAKSVNIILTAPHNRDERPQTAHKRLKDAVEPHIERFGYLSFNLQEVLYCKVFLIK